MLTSWWPIPGACGVDEFEEDRLADPIDVGSHNEEVSRREAIARQQAKAAPRQIRNADGTWPVTECECGAQIAEGRLNLGYDTCIDCARLAELKRKQYAS